MSYSELNLPQQETGGINANKWFVSESGTNMCLVNDTFYTLEAAGGTEAENTKFYFNTLLDAHICSVGYYADVGLKYPYMYEWEAAKNNEFNKNAVAGAGTLSEPQVMDFI